MNIRWAENVESMRKKGNAYKVSGECRKYEGEGKCI
jgi:hypothetical protein